MGREIEKRVFPVREFRVSKDDNGGSVLAGYSAVFDSRSENLGWGDFEVREMIAPGAFTRALKGSDCRALFNHDPNFVLGRESAGTLKITEDNRGLFSEISLPDTSFARDLGVSVQRGDIKEQSFCFVVSKDVWKEDRQNKIATRTILEVEELIDISPVTYPAYPETDIAKRSFERFTSSNVSGQDTSGSLIGKTQQRLRVFDLKYKMHKALERTKKK